MSTASLLRWLQSGFQNGQRKRGASSISGLATAARRRRMPRLEPLEGRMLLAAITVSVDGNFAASSSGSPGRGLDSVTYTERLTMGGLMAVTAEIERTATNLARTHNLSGASARLTHLASEIPGGLQHLAPVWRHDLANTNPQTLHARQAFKRQLLTDLKHNVAAAAAAGELRLTGPGAADYLRSADSAQSSLDSVTIHNRTGFNIAVTAFLRNTPRSITRTITSQGSQFFDFGSATNNFISINVARADGRTPPPPFNGVSLDRPFQGYSGTSFSISVFGGYFTKAIG